MTCPMIWLCDDVGYLVSLIEGEQDPSNQEDQGLFSYVYIFKRKFTVCVIHIETYHPLTNIFIVTIGIFFQ